MPRSRNDKPISAPAFLDELRRYRRGSVSRRHFLGVTGLGTATATLAAAMPWLKPRAASAAGEIGDRVALATWPNYHDPANFEAFTAATGAAVQVNVFGSNEEMLAKLQAGGTGWDVFVPTNYTISTYQKLGIIEPLDLALLPNFDAAANQARFMNEGSIDGMAYAVPKDWGTTGYIVNTAKATTPMTSWKQFWDMSQEELSGRVTVHDYQLTTIGNALKYFGHSFNSVDSQELAQAEELLLKVKPHLFAITSDYQPALRSAAAPRPARDAVRDRQGGRRDLERFLRRAEAGGQPQGRLRADRLPARPGGQRQGGDRPRLPDHRRAGGEAPAAGDHGKLDPLPGAGAADAPGIRCGGDSHRSCPGRDHGAVQGGVG
jgi:hypothetical protein